MSSRSRLFFAIFHLLIPLLNGQLLHPSQAIRPQSSTNDAPCLQRPPNCDLNCPFGFRWGLGRTCVCFCQIDPCQTKSCPLNEVCTVRQSNSRIMAECVSQIVSKALVGSKVGECPRTLGGPCSDQCLGDSDCGGALKCCPNGCGKHCMLPLAPQIKSSQPIKPIFGQCPPATAVRERKCTADCEQDDDCPGVAKCCENGCAKVCSAPEKATGCIHLASAVDRLPSRALTNGFIPRCSIDGRFEAVQCDAVYCWCVDPTLGAEIAGTKLFKNQARPDCSRPRDCPGVQCSNSCPYGLKTLQNGCPVNNCECRNICDDVRCSNAMDDCQLVEPDCQQPPCLPVPRCLLNPCSHGLPMTLPNGVTALCTHSNQCSQSYWCHMIGYNGLGFCCPQPESASRDGTCPARVPRFAEACTSECRTDPDCRVDSKCCFDGCALKCTSTSFSPLQTQTQQTASSIDIGLSSSSAECPDRLPPIGVSACKIECHEDGDCAGWKRCCSSGCSKQCVYPTKATACVHEAISHELYSLRGRKKCAQSGNFEPLQCDDSSCFCVDSISGFEVAGTRSPPGQTPNCPMVARRCPPIDCTQACPYEWVMTAQGCPTCECRNPCTGVRCSQTQICIVTRVDCFDPQRCPAQPRCIENFCPAGPPYTNRNGHIERCQTDAQCPGGFWCNNVGIVGHGICCPSPAKPQKQGKCPVIAPLLDGIETCKIDCRSDGDCTGNDKCCYDGCGTTCLAVETDTANVEHSGSPHVVDRQCPAHTTVPELVVRSCQQLCAKDSDCSENQICCRISCASICVATQRLAPKLSVVGAYKLGQCSTIEPRSDCSTTTARCVDDRQCPGTQKCCHDGCTKRCAYPKKNTACLHLKSALEEIGITTVPRCSADDGLFEPVQCSSNYCYCVTKDGREIEGTRVGKNELPNCEARRVCPITNCVMPNCLFGFEMNELGCAKCECADPCKNITCSQPYHFCMVSSVECIAGSSCPPVPRCVPSACPQGFPLLNETTRQTFACLENNQCRHTPVSSFCRLFRHGDGYCCPKPEPRYNPGLCPAIEPTPDATCTVQCHLDDSCANNEKCCFNGCGMSCMPADFASPPRIREVKIGECSRIEDMGAICGVRRVTSCERDSDCPSIQKCCFDGCGRTCAYPYTTTACLHEQASAELIDQGMQMIGQATNRLLPQCDSEGAYVQVQSFRGFQWCVNNAGREIPGTRTTLRSPQCHLARSCPLFSCTRHCPHGYKTDNDGCEQCICRDPCEGVQCPHVFQVCRLVAVDCFDTHCSPVAKCVLNACPSGEPLASVDSQVLASCDESQGQRCPNGFFCHRIGMGSAKAGYCCRGTGTLSFTTEQCPIVLPISRPSDNAICHLQCRTDTDCAGRQCCFNGCGTSCRSLRSGGGQSPVIQPQGGSNRVSSAEKLGTCPVNPISNPGCRSDCTRDSECSGFHKCCAYGCGKLCQFPRVATACIHRLATHDEESKKSATAEPVEIACATDGSFEEVQCSRRTSQCCQCWCVDAAMGNEIIGTRVSIFGARPNCTEPKFCATKCRDQYCEHGFRLDKDGCPSSGFCECKNPCEDLQCARSNDVCILKPVACLQPPCPSIPTCKNNPCMGGADAIRDQYGNAISCNRDDDCGRGQCRQLPGGEQRLGVCCPRDASSSSFVSSSKIGRCPEITPGKLFAATNCTKECGSDSDCDDVQKCCSYGCNRVCATPNNATNCIHRRSAFDALKEMGAIVTMHKPQCDARSDISERPCQLHVQEPDSGLFVSTQCDDSDKCWCVDTVTGNELYGTRSLQIQSAFNVCANRRQCAISCDERTTVCPFGLDLSKDGCARNANCRCRNPCDEVQCPQGFVCLVRPLDCRDQTCLPVPTCERNPCIGNQQPAVEPRTYTQFTCLENRTQICPTGFYCTGYASSNRQGVCCPGQEPIIDLSSHDRTSSFGVCPHGDAFSNSPDGIPARCTITNNGCPSTHYCLSKAGQLEGICCVSKRYVCNLAVDAGPCHVSVTRYYYDVENTTCLRFNYGGCSGNLNNFATAFECEKFCTGTGVDAVPGVVNDAGQLEEIFQMGFSLTGPLLREKHKSDVNDAFRQYLVQRFGVDEGDIRDLTIRDDNTVRFSVQSIDAKEKAQNISNAVSNGNFFFEYRGDAYKAQPHTWFSHQVSREEAGTSAFLFWMLLVACVVFAIIIMTALCLACSFIFRKGKQPLGSSYRSSSPSNYVANTGYASNSHSPNSDTTNPADDLNDRQSVFSTDDIEEMRARQFGLDRKGAAGGGHGALIWQEPHAMHPQHGHQHQLPLPQHPGGAGRRRSSRTTLYY